MKVIPPPVADPFPEDLHNAQMIGLRYEPESLRVAGPAVSTSPRNARRVHELLLQRK